MRISVINRVREQLYRQSRRRHWLMLVTCLACIVVFITTYMLILPAITLESSAATLNCEDSLHTHTENCYDTEGSLICGYADFAVHTHDSGCYDQNGNLICPLPEIQLHTHTDECYGPVDSAGETHVHTEDCYDAQQGQLVCGQETERELICGKDEIILHSHEESCYGDNGELICGQLQIEEHIHGLECYGDAGVDGENAGEPKSSLADGETAGDWETTLDSLSLNSVSDDLSGTELQTIDSFYLWLWASLRKDEGGVDPIEVKQLPKWVGSGNGIDGSGWDGTGITDVRKYTDADETYYLIPINYFKENYGAYGYSFDPENPGECPFQYAPDANQSKAGLTSAVYVQADGEWYVRIQDKTENVTPPRSNIYYLFSEDIPVPAGEFYLWLQAYRMDNGSKTKEEIFMHPANWSNGGFVDSGVTDVLTYGAEGETYYLIPIHYFTENYGDRKYGYSFDPENPGECPFQYAPDADNPETGLIPASYVKAGGEWYVQIQDKTANTALPRSNIYYEYTYVYGIVTDTVNHMGSVINLFDYWTTAKDDSDAVNGVTESGVNADHALKFGRNLGNVDQYGKWNVYTGAYAGVYPGIVKNKLEDGYPVLSGDAEVFTPQSPSAVSIGSTKESLAYLFDPKITSDYKEIHRNVSGLLQVDAHGYYYYNSQENFAEYNEDTNSFILYDTGGVNHVGKSPDGQFFPFNTIQEAANVNSENAVINHYFGMTLTTRFVQQYGGHTTASRGTDTVFNFSGDDDVWIFIDDVLVADLGGIHDAAQVEINFATGQVTVSRTCDDQHQFAVQTTTTLKEAFEAAEVNNVDWNGNTFVDNSYHTLKFYYLERGNADSNLWLQYNLNTVMENSIFKVNQYGDPVPGAVFAVYAADSNYRMLADLNGESVNLGEGDISYDLDPNSPSYGSILGNVSADGTRPILAKSLYTGTTDNKGEMVFVDEDNMPYTLSELETMFGEHFLLREIVMPEGYRKVSGEVKLRIANQVLLCDNTYESGIYAAPNLLITAPNDIMLTSYSNNLQNENSGTARNVSGDERTIIHYYDADGKENGIVFAVVLKYTGPKNSDGESSQEDLRKRENWAPLYGTNKVGFTVVDVEKNFGGDFIAAVIDTAKRYVESDNVLSLSASGQMQGILNGLPGDISTYYYMLGSEEKGKTQYTVAYYWSSADSLDKATSANTYRIDADKETAGVNYEFTRNFGSTISVPNLLNRLFVQKFDEDGNPVNGAVFAMYQVEEPVPSQIYYVACDGTLIHLEPDEDGDNRGEAKIRQSGTESNESGNESNESISGTYQIDRTSGQITVTDETGTVYVIDAKPYGIDNGVAVTGDRRTDKNIGENGSSYFTNMSNGKYYVREIKAPEGYELNSTEVMVLVDDDAVYANAGTADDGVTVGRGSGYVVSTLDQFASQGDINNTLTWIYQMMRVSGVSNTFADSDFSNGAAPSWGYLVENRNGSLTTLDEASKLKIYLQYDANAESEGNALFNYGLNRDRYEEMGKDPATIQRRLYTDVGWSYYEIYQDSRWALGYSDVNNGIYFSEHRKEGAGYDILTNDGSGTGQPTEIAHLFSRATYIQVTDRKLSHLEIGKTVINPTASEDEPDQTSFTFTVNLFSGYTEKRDEDGNIVTDEDGNPVKEPVSLTGEYAYTVYDVSVNGAGETVRTTATHEVEGETVKYAGSFTADSANTLTLTDKQVVVIKNLPCGTLYTITETENPDYSASWTVNGGQKNSGTAASGQLIWALEEGTLNNTSVVSFTNTYLPPVDLTIKKTDAAGAAVLEGAKFKLSRTVVLDGRNVLQYYGENGQWGTDEKEQATLETDEDGLIKITGLTDGVYTLTETAAPDGYQITSDGVVSFTVTGRSILEDGSIRKDNGSGQINAYVLTVKNSRGYMLPNTGGAGTLPYTVGGALMIGTGFLYGGRLRRKRER